MGSLRIACLGLENQTAVDDDMALRIMGYEGAEYRTQLFKENKSKPRYPVVSIVLYLGYEKDGAAQKHLLRPWGSTTAIRWPEDWPLS